MSRYWLCLQKQQISCVQICNLHQCPIYIYFVATLGPIAIGEYQRRLQLHNTMQHQHMSSNGFDSPPTLSFDMSKVVKPTNVISTLVNGTNIGAQH